MDNVILFVHETWAEQRQREERALRAWNAGEPRRNLPPRPLTLARYVERELSALFMRVTEAVGRGEIALSQSESIINTRERLLAAWRQ